MSSGATLVQIAQQEAVAVAAPLRNMIVDGIVETAEDGKASVRIGGLSAPPLSGFTYPPSLAPLPGDHVLAYRLGGYQLIMFVLNRNAIVGTGGGTVVAGDGVSLPVAFFL